MKKKCHRRDSNTPLGRKVKGFDRKSALEFFAHECTKSYDYYLKAHDLLSLMLENYEVTFWHFFSTGKSMLNQPFSRDLRGDHEVFGFSCYEMK